MRSQNRDDAADKHVLSAFFVNNLHTGALAALTFQQARIQRGLIVASNAVVVQRSAIYEVALAGVYGNAIDQTDANINLLLNGVTLTTARMEMRGTGDWDASVEHQTVFMNKGDVLALNATHTDGANVRIIQAWLQVTEQ